MVSVVIPVYNREFELKRAVKSVLNQTIQNFEILVIDDFSEVDLKIICANFSDTRIKYHKLEKKGNGNICRNYGIKIAEGSYIAMLDSDDEWLPTHLESKIKFLESNNCDGVFGSFKVNNGEVLIDAISRPFDISESYINYILSDGISQTSTFLFKSKIVKNIKWDEKLKRHQDYDFGIKFSSHFKFMPCESITCIVHWKKGEKRNHHLNSQIQFINTYKKIISPVLYNTYFRKLYFEIYNDKSISREQKNYVKKSSYEFFSSVSLKDYMSVSTAMNRNILLRVYHRLIFYVKKKLRFL